MIRGLYTSAAGMAAQMEAQDVSANNLANANTSGFKRELATFSTYREMNLSRIQQRANLGVQVTPIGTLGTGVWLDQVTTVMDPGPLQETGRQLDFALEGEGFFVVNTPTGRHYTRNGAFSVGAGGELVTATGHVVLGQGGQVLQADQENLVDELMVATFPQDAALDKRGESLFATEAPPQVQPAGQRIKQGFLEQANVNVVTAMVEMLAGMRAYEANQKAIQAHDQTLDKLVNEVGRVR